LSIPISGGDPSQSMLTQPECEDESCFLSCAWRMRGFLFAAVLFCLVGEEGMFKIDPN